MQFETCLKFGVNTKFVLGHRDYQTNSAQRAELVKIKNHHCLVSATEVLELAQLVFTTDLLAISSMSEVWNEHKVCFGTP